MALIIRLLSAVPLGACSSIDHAGLSVSIIADAPPPQAIAEGRVFDTNLGYHVTLTRGFVATASVEVLRCPMAEISEFIRPWWSERVAHAHITGSPTFLGIPFVQSLSGVRSLTVGTLYPPPDHYCWIRRSLGPPDGDALGMAGNPDMVGKALLIEGAFSREGSADQFTARSSGSISHPEALGTLDVSLSGHQSVTIALSTTLLNLFDNAAFDSDSSEKIGQIVLQNLVSAMSSHVN